MLNQLLSNRVEKTPSTEVSADRYEFLTLSEAEPDLGVPSSNSYILASSTTGTRSWINPATSLTSPGSDKQVVFNNSGVLAGASGLVYDTASGRVGIGVADPTAELELAETWNNAGTTFTHIKSNVTDTASNAASLLLNLQVGGSSKVYIDKTGLINSTGFLIGATTPGTVTGAHGFTRNGNNLYVYTAGTLRYNFSTSSFNTILPIGFGTAVTSPDTFFLREAANTLAQRNNSSAQKLRVYNTYTDASNYELATMGWNSNILELGQEYAGTGSPRNINIKFGTNVLYLNNGASNITPVMAISGASSKAAGFLVGSSGSAFIFDSTGPFNLAIDSKSNITSGASNGGTSRLHIDTTGRIGINTTSPSAKLDVVGDIEVNSNVNINSEATTLATVTKTQVASFALASFRSGKLIVQAYDSVTGEVQISELLVAHNGTVVSATEYGVVFTGANSIITYDVDISAGNVILTATRSSANSTQYKISKTLMVA